MDAHLHSVSTRAELERYIEDLLYARSSSSARLTHLSSSVHAEERLKEVQAAQSRLTTSLPAASAASVLFSSANGVGKGVRSRIEDVVVLYERAKSAKEIVDQVITLKSSIQGLYGAMEMRDWERAAQLACKAREIPEYIAGSEFAVKMVPTIELPDPPLVSLSAACDDLSKLFAREFNSASAQRQMDQATRYFKLFPLVGHDATGLKLYAQFICQIVAGLSRQLLSSAEQSAKQNPSFFAAVLSRLFENIVSIIDQHSKVVAKHYGDAAMPQSVVPDVQAEVDKQAGLILDTFWDDRRMEMLLASCNQYSYPILVNTFTVGSAQTAGAANISAEDEAYDLQEGSARLTELGTLLNRWSLYKLFIQQKWKDGNGDTTTITHLVKVLDESNVSTKITEILGPTYDSLSLFVFRRSVERAIQLDELPSRQVVDANPLYTIESPLVSSAVDDILYVFSNLLSQTVDTGHLKTELTAIATYRRVLESDLIGAFQRKLRSTAPVDGITASSGTGADTLSGASAFMIYLNDLEVCMQYVRETIAKYVDADGSVSIPTELKEALTKFDASFKNKASELLADGCQTLAAARIAGKARQLIAASFKNDVYTAQADASRCGLMFSDQWRLFMKPFRQLLHPRVLAQVLNIVLPALASQLEKFIWGLNGKISGSGCISLDRDVSLVIAVTSEVQYSLRHCFIKLAQLVNALNDRDLPAEELSALNSDERQRLMKFRVIPG